MVTSGYGPRNCRDFIHYSLFTNLCVCEYWFDLHYGTKCLNVKCVQVLGFYRIIRTYSCKRCVLFSVERIFEFKICQSCYCANNLECPRSCEDRPLLRSSIAAVLNCGPGDPLICIFCRSVDYLYDLD